MDSLDAECSLAEPQTPTSKGDTNERHHRGACIGVKSFSLTLPPLLAVPSADGSPGGAQAVVHEVLDRFEKLKLMQHPNLAPYIDVVVGRHGRVFLVSEHRTTTLRDVFAPSHTTKKPSWPKWEAKLKRPLFSLLLALKTLAEHGVVHHNLTAEACLVNPATGELKLADYGVYYMTRLGALVPFPIGEPKYLAPEVVASTGGQAATPKSDIWALGLMLIELVNGRPLWYKQDATAEEVMNKLEKMYIFESPAQTKEGECSLDSQTEGGSVCDTKTTASEVDEPPETKLLRIADSCWKYMTEEIIQQDKFWSVSRELQDVIRCCLQLDPVKRTDAEQLLAHDYFASLYEEHKKCFRWVVKPFLQCSFLPDPGSECGICASDTGDANVEEEKDATPHKGFTSHSGHVRKRSPMPGTPMSAGGKANHSLAEIYHFWKLNGGDPARHLAPELRVTPAILRLPTVVRLSDFSPTTPYRNHNDKELLFDKKIHTVSVEKLQKQIVANKKAGSRLKQRQEKEFRMSFSFADLQECSGRALPSRDVREGDIDYQRHRVALFRKLLDRYPSSTREILKEAQIDIPPMLRGEIWTVLLAIPDNAQEIYDAIDNKSPTSSDHQIDLDIPRCHQYHPLLSSKEGHQRLRNILKAWVAANPEWTYWQGLDSLLAPFVTLNFNDEARAYACLMEVVHKYLHNFFLKDNATYLQGHLLIFRQLLGYHDPQLAVHLHQLGFNPELFAIPWFLTIFTHILKIDEIYRLWDRLLLQTTAFPLFLAVAIMMHLRDRLLAMDFNQLILYFSKFTDVNMDVCVTQASELYASTPVSILVRRFRVGDEPAIAEPSRPWERLLTIDQMRNELAPRVNAEEMASFKPKMIALDIREKEDFDAFCFPGATHVSLRDTTIKDLLLYHGKHIVLIGNRTDSAQKLANRLVKTRFPFVCVLHGGIEAVRELLKPEEPS